MLEDSIIVRKMSMCVLLTNKVNFISSPSRKFLKKLDFLQTTRW